MFDKNKKCNKYKIQLQEIELSDGSHSNRTIEIEFENHDDIINLIELTKNSNRFKEKSQNIEFIIGLKLFTEVLLKNRNNSLFEDLLPFWGNFMKKVKNNI
jgi:hypothetical protein